MPVSRATVARYIQRGMPDVGPGHGKGALPAAPARPGRPPRRKASAGAGVAGATARALEEGDDLEGLVREAARVDAGLDNWGEHIDRDPHAVRAYQQLIRIRTDLTKAIVELRPRPEAEAERLEAFGVLARAKLVERAQRAAVDRQAEREELLKLRKWIGVLQVDEADE